MTQMKMLYLFSSVNQKSDLFTPFAKNGRFSSFFTGVRENEGES